MTNENDKPKKMVLTNEEKLKIMSMAIQLVNIVPGNYLEYYKQIVSLIEND